MQWAHGRMFLLLLINGEIIESFYLEILSFNMLPATITTTSTTLCLYPQEVFCPPSTTQLHYPLQK
jgi:hypothetical protein